VITPVVRTTYIEFSDVANSGATLLSIKSGTTTLLSMAPTVGIKHFTYSDFNSNYVYNIKEINGIEIYWVMVYLLQQEDHSRIYKLRVPLMCDQ
ncbi:MAG: hypothetical protein ACKPKO_50095, partial [Candidatus Fonsibacter sp.]